MSNSTVAIVYHRADMDGVCSALIAAFYEKMNFPSKHRIQFIGYDYADSPTEVHISLHHIENLEYIYMLDVTLPNELLDKFADKIIAIDHHDKAIERLVHYVNKFKEYHCAVSHENVYDINGNVAKKAAACELTWVTLFQNIRMPEVVRLCGRYDVWNHNDVTLPFNEYCKSLDLIEHILPRFSWWDDGQVGIPAWISEASTVFIESVFACFENALYQSKPYMDISFKDTTPPNKWLEDAIAKGTTIYEHRKMFDRSDAKLIAKTCIVKGTCINAIVANQANRNSTFFNGVSLPGIHQCAIAFYYNIAKSSWTVSFYALYGDIDLQPIFDIILANPNNKVTSHGGHMMKACGLVTNDIQEDLLQYLGFVE